MIFFASGHHFGHAREAVSQSGVAVRVCVVFDYGVGNSPHSLYNQ